MTPIRVLLFELGSIQVYHTGEYVGNTPSGVFWQCLKAQRAYGPFPTLSQAMSHLAMYSYNVVYDPNVKQVQDVIGSDQVTNVIMVDFRIKRRIFVGRA